MSVYKILIAAVAVLHGFAPAAAIDNGLGVTPPRGWRSWNLFALDINDTVMRGQMDAVLDKSRKVNGKPTTLAELGFDWISMDDGWQKCNCSGPKWPDPTEPSCPKNCKMGGCGWHTGDAAGGVPVVDKHKFPDMKAMVDHGHSLGLKVGSYLNNCMCMEGGDPPMGAHCTSPTHYEQDVAFIMEAGFDGVKIDNCGSSHNVSRWAELFNATGKPIRIESCHTFHPNHGTPSGWPNFPVWDPATKAADASCPMNLYRTGGDIKPSFASIIGDVYATVQYNDRPDPFSHPGCWAYPDMQEVGNFVGPDPLRFNEERMHWGLWCVISSPLILGLDMTNQANMDRIWPTVTNTEALAVNDAWAGKPGTLVRSYPATGVDGVATVVDQSPCDGGADTLGWKLSPGGELTQGGDATLCLSDLTSPSGQSGQMMDCPTPTTEFWNSGCGALFTDCKAAKGAWSYNATSQLLIWAQTKEGTLPTNNTTEHRGDVTQPCRGRECTAEKETLRAWAEHQSPGLDAIADGHSSPTLGAPPNTQPPKCLAAHRPAPVGGFYGGPKGAYTGPSGGCPHASAKAPVANTSTFTFSAKGEIQSGNGFCLSARKLYGAQLWSKPMGGGKVAVLVVNLLEQQIEFKLPLADVPELGCGSTLAGDGPAPACTVRDIWNHKDLPPTTSSSSLAMTLGPHGSNFYILGAPFSD